MPDNYEHYISKNIQAFYRRRLFSPMIYLVLLAVLWIVFPLGAMLRPAQLSGNTKIADAYKDHHRYVRMTFTDLKFSGYTCETYGQTADIIITPHRKIIAASFSLPRIHVRKDSLRSTV